MLATSSPAASRTNTTAGSTNGTKPNRAELMAQLDAAYFLLYGIDRDDAEYILSTFNGIHDRSTLFPNSPSTAERILALYDEYAAAE